MRKLIGMICMGFLSGVFVLSAQDAPKPAAARNDDAQLRASQQQGGMQRVSEYLMQNDPKKFEEMKKLRLENPEEFEKQMTAISQKMRGDSQKERDEFKVLADKYRETKSDADKAALKAKLEEYMNKRIEMQKRRIEEMEKNIVQLKSNLADDEKNIQTKIDERLNQVLTNTEGKRERKTEPAK